MPGGRVAAGIEVDMRLAFDPSPRLIPVPVRANIFRALEL